MPSCKVGSKGGTAPTVGWSGRNYVRVPRKNQQWALIAVLGPEITNVTEGKFSAVEIKRSQPFESSAPDSRILRGD